MKNRAIKLFVVAYLVFNQHNQLSLSAQSTAIISTINSHCQHNEKVTYRINLRIRLNDKNHILFLKHLTLLYYILQTDFIILY